MIELLLAVLISCISAYPQVDKQADNAFKSLQSLTSGTSITARIIGAISILLGLIIAFFGYQLLDMILGIAGFVVFGDLAYFILVRSEPSSGYGEWRTLILLIVPVVVGILGAILAYSIFRIGLALVGFLGGASLAIWILSFQSGGVIANDWGRLILIIAIGLFMAIAIQFAQRPMIVLSTALAGSLMAFMGLDSFINTGYNRITQLFLFGGVGLEGFRYTTSEGAWWMVGATFVLFLIASAYQFKYGNYHKVSKY